ncbi:MAG: OmpA family protein [Saprospiraceae bacterium]
MKLIKVLAPLVLLLLGTHLQAQHALLEAYISSTDNSGYLKNVRVKILDAETKTLQAELKTDRDGFFTVKLPLDQEYSIVAEKKHFFQKSELISTKGKKAEEKVFAKLKMERKPGYIFDVTIAEPQRGEATVDAIDSARIEIFNNTRDKEELVLENYPHPSFKFTFEHGNHYTILIRRDGYLNKRIEAYVNIEGCILCFDGLGIVEPGVTDVLSNGLQMGTFLANVELEPLEIDKTFDIENIYYDYNKWAIRPDAALELDKLVGVLKDNPKIIVELGSHTDARGKDPYNLSLSEKRAIAAVDYLVEFGGIDPTRLTSKGYGESALVNDCGNNANCPEKEHQLNRRTQLKIVGIQDFDPIAQKSLQDILTEERLLQDVYNSEIIEVDANGNIKKSNNR